MPSVTKPQLMVQGDHKICTFRKLKSRWSWQDVRCLWWKLTKAGAPKHLTTPVQTLNPKFQTLNPKFQTLNPKQLTRTPKP
ncbi:hypothetical protein T484DRAFT_1963506 [Baffinella frigidus]|nr:hypothetical protein T484DRAFT_1963506 [Cryptophyta sp. CCMP2293]